MKKVLLIDDSNLFREYLANKLKENGFEVIEATNGLEGLLKLRNEMPDLVIMEYYLTRKSSIEILKEKEANPNVASVPVIMVSNRIDREKILSVARYKVKKFFSKPIKLDALLQAISGFLKVKVEIDSTPCIIEAHFNDEILFIEIALGLNPEKIELLKFKIMELIQLYGVDRPKVLLMLSNIELTEADDAKLKLLFDTVLDQTGAKTKAIKVLASSDYLKDFISKSPDYHGIEIKESLDMAMDDLLGLRPDSIAHDEVAAERILSKSAPVSDSEESIDMRFESEKHKKGETRIYPEAKIAVVDDDIVIQELVKTVLSETGWTLETFNNGKEFVTNLVSNDYDLVFLDLMMPEMNGFQVLQFMKQQKIEVPTIVLSALTRKETVGKAMSFGVKSYVIKPVKPENLQQKAFEILASDF
jgi:DNA-binding response OmpR family regulator